MKRSMLILGAGGFVGSHLMDYLVARGDHDLVGIDVSSEKLEPSTLRRIRFLRADLRRDFELVERAIREADVVVDLVAHANPSLYVTSPIEVFELNFTQNLRVARLCMRHRKRLIQYSSAEVYGKTHEGDSLREDDSDLTFGPIHRQRWIYASGKMLLERILYAHGLAGELEHTVIRPFNFLGTRFDYLVPAGTRGGPRVFAHMMSALLTGGPIQLVDGGHVHRAFLHIEDACRAFGRILDHREETRNQAYNVGNPGNDVTIRGLAREMLALWEELTGRPAASTITDVSGEEFYGRGYEDADRLPPNIDKMRALGWEPTRDLRSTLRETMAHYLSRGQSTPQATANAR